MNYFLVFSHIAGEPFLFSGKLSIPVILGTTMTFLCFDFPLLLTSLTQDIDMSLQLAYPHKMSHQAQV
jgi:hypothetical protein